MNMQDNNKLAYNCAHRNMYGAIAQETQCLYRPCRQEPISLCVESSKLQHTAQCWNQNNCHTLPHSPPPKNKHMNKNITDLLHTNCSHGWFSGEAGLQVAQNFLHTLTERAQHFIIWIYSMKYKEFTNSNKIKFKCLHTG